MHFPHYSSARTNTSVLHFPTLVPAAVSEKHAALKENKCISKAGGAPSNYGWTVLPWKLWGRVSPPHPLWKAVSPRGLPALSAEAGWSMQRVLASWLLSSPAHEQLPNCPFPSNDCLQFAKTWKCLYASHTVSKQPSFFYSSHSEVEWEQVTAV